ncbi:MAG: hypothetical protein ABI675_27770 [Chitinophagaceae bacterium]
MYYSGIFAFADYPLVNRRFANRFTHHYSLHYKSSPGEQKKSGSAFLLISLSLPTVLKIYKPTYS